MVQGCVTYGPLAHSSAVGVCLSSVPPSQGPRLWLGVPTVHLCLGFPCSGWCCCGRAHWVTPLPLSGGVAGRGLDFAPSDKLNVSEE